MKIKGVSQNLSPASAALWAMEISNPRVWIIHDISGQKRKDALKG
jgi:hypothetical protein